MTRPASHCSRPPSSVTGPLIQRSGGMAEADPRFTAQMATTLATTDHAHESPRPDYTAHRRRGGSSSVPPIGTHPLGDPLLQPIGPSQRADARSSVGAGWSRLTRIRRRKCPKR